MVHLSRIVTRTGDDGTTGLGDGTRLPKDHPRIEACGAVDELNAILGLLISAHGDDAQRPLLQSISNDLFDLGADLTMPGDGNSGASATALRITAAHVERLEEAVERLNRDLPPLKSFVLPGGLPAAAWSHLARTVCRRAERRVVSLNSVAPLNPHLLKYLNRLSDLLFVLARSINRDGSEVLWMPGGGIVEEKTE